MELKEQVCSLELAKELKELGVKQESLFWWDGYTNFEDEIKLEYGKPDFVAGDAMFYSAFTVAELGEMLPRGYMSFHDSIGKWFCEDLDTFIQPGYKEIPDDYNTEAVARAKMLIYLLENKLIK